MEEKTIRWQLRFDIYVEGLKNLEDIIPHFNELNTIEKARLIPRYETIFWLGWNVMKDYLKEVGYSGKLSLKPVLHQMSEDGLIVHSTWEDMVYVRDEFNDNYAYELNIVYIDKIIKDYVPALVDFKTKMLELI